MNPPDQLITEALHTTTLLIYRERGRRWPPWSMEHRGLAYHYTIYIWRKEMKPPWSIDHRCLAYHYTLYTHTHIDREREEGDEPPGQSITDALHTITPYIYTHIIYIYIYIGRRWTPWSIDHRGLAYHYTAYIYIGRRWTPQSIEHRGLAYHYTSYI